MRMPEWMAELMPDSMLTPEQMANRRVDSETRNLALEAAHKHLSELTEAARLFEKAEEFVQAKTHELKKIQDALVFSRGDETLILQGRAMALYEFVRTPERVREEIERLRAHINEIESADAG